MGATAPTSLRGIPWGQEKCSNPFMWSSPAPAFKPLLTKGGSLRAPFSPDPNPPWHREAA